MRSDIYMAPSTTCEVSGADRMLVHRVRWSIEICKGTIVEGLEGIKTCTVCIDCAPCCMRILLGRTAFQGDFTLCLTKGL